MAELVETLAGQPIALQVLVLGLSAFLLEDAICLMAGVLISQGLLNPIVGFLGCWVGIGLGNLALWIGAWSIGPAIVRQPWMQRLVSEDALSKVQTWSEAHGIWVVVISRLVPGTRLAAYVAAGALRLDGLRFPILATLAATIWVGVLIGAGHAVGPRAIDAWNQTPWSKLLGVLVGCGALWVAWRTFKVRLKQRLRSKDDRS